MGWPHVHVLTAPRPTESIMKRIAVSYSLQVTQVTCAMPVRPQWHVCRYLGLRRVAVESSAMRPAPTFLSFTHYFSVLTNGFFTGCKAELAFRNDCPVSLVPHPYQQTSVQSACGLYRKLDLPSFHLNRMPRNAMASMTSILAIGNNPCLRRSGHGAVLVSASTVARGTRGICSRLEAEVLKVVSIKAFMSDAS